MYTIEQRRLIENYQNLMSELLKDHLNMVDLRISKLEDDDIQEKAHEIRQHQLSLHRRNLLRKMDTKKIKGNHIFDIFKNVIILFFTKTNEAYLVGISSLKTKPSTRYNLQLINKLECNNEETRAYCFIPNVYKPGMFTDSMSVEESDKEYVMTYLKEKTFTEADELQEIKENTSCSVCLERRKVNERVVELSCGHTFHRVCGVRSLVPNAKCPLCRQYFYVEFPSE